jgi:regulator of cell morphogenesis and NO signaling
MTHPISISSYRSGHIQSSDQSNGLQNCPRIEDDERSKEEKGILAGMVLEAQHAATVRKEPIQDFSQVSLSELIEYIVRNHHDYIREEIPRLHALCEQVIASRKWRNPELIDLARNLRRLSGDLTFHMSHTESKVFPYIEALERSRNDGSPLGPLSATQAENLIEEVMVGHTPAGDTLKQIEADTNGFTPPEDACPDMVGLYDGLKELANKRSSHVQLEGYILFPRALALEKEVLAA